MGKHTTIEQDKANMTRYRVTFEEFEGDGLAYVDFTDLHEAGDFIIHCICTDCVNVGYTELAAMR